MSNSSRKKGISLSSTPNKINQPITPFVLNQTKLIPNIMTSNVTPIQPKIIHYRPEVQFRNVDPQTVKFNYSSPVYKAEIDQSIALDRQILELKKELTDKKSRIQNLESEIYRQKMYNPSLQSHIHSEYVSPPLSMRTNNYEQFKKVQITKSEVNYVKQQNPNIKVSEISLKESQKLSPQKKSRKQSPEKVVATKIIQVKKDEENKQNATKMMMDQRYEQLKFAQEKLLEIINICENGL